MRFSLFLRFKRLLVKMAVIMFLFCVATWITDTILYDLMRLKPTAMSALLFGCICTAHTHFSGITISFLWESVAELQRYIFCSKCLLLILILSISFLSVFYLIHFIGVHFFLAYCCFYVDYDYAANVSVTNATFTKKYKIYVIT